MTAASCLVSACCPATMAPPVRPWPWRAICNRHWSCSASCAPCWRPLLSPRLLLDEHYAYVYWLDSCGAGAQQRFLLEASMTAVVALARQLCGERLPWQFHFSHAQPRYVEQYWVHLGEDLHFSSPYNLLRLPRHYLTRALPQAALTTAVVACQQAREQLLANGPRASLLDCLQRWLLRHVREAPSLERAAAAFAMSPATFKRKLQ